MPRDLSEVLHYFLPEPATERDATVDPRESPDPSARSGGAGSRGSRQTALSRPFPSSVLPIIAVPIGDHDVLRAAFTWNVAVEIARLGGRAVVIAPGWEDPSPLWPEAGVGPLGAELLPSRASDLGALYRLAIDTAIAQSVGARDGGAILVRVPPEWLCAPTDGVALLRWTMLFTSAHATDLLETYGLGKLVLSTHEAARVGVAIHGVRSLGEARNAFERLAHTTRTHLQRDLLSYGVLVDDLHVYRAIVAQRPIGLAHPQSTAARALADVARMLLDDARGRALA